MHCPSIGLELWRLDGTSIARGHLESGFLLYFQKHVALYQISLDYLCTRWMMDVFLFTLLCRIASLGVLQLQALLPTTGHALLGFRCLHLSQHAIPLRFRLASMQFAFSFMAFQSEHRNPRRSNKRAPNHHVTAGKSVKVGATPQYSNQR